MKHMEARQEKMSHLAGEFSLSEQRLAATLSTLPLPPAAAATAASAAHTRTGRNSQKSTRYSIATECSIL